MNISIQIKKKQNKHKQQVYKIGLDGTKSKGSYHKKSESLTQAKMRQLINNKEISFQKLNDNQQNTPYTTKYSKSNMGESKVHHAHHNSVALHSPKCNQIVSSSTGSTRELKTTSTKVPMSKQKSNKPHMTTGKASPTYMHKESIQSDISDKITMSHTGKMANHVTPSIKYDPNNGNAHINDFCINLYSIRYLIRTK